jgi:hypothetical protein
VYKNLSDYGETIHNAAKLCITGFIYSPGTWENFPMVGFYYANIQMQNLSKWINMLYVTTNCKDMFDYHFNYLL